jgi:hypothetical protein
LWLQELFEKKLSAGFPPKKTALRVAAEHLGWGGEQVLSVIVDNFGPRAVVKD